MDGKMISKKVREEIAQKISQNKTRPPTLATIMVGEDPDSLVYFKSQQKACTQVGILPKPVQLSETSTQKEVIHMVHMLNHDPEVDGIIMQMPLPKHLQKDEIIQEISWKKDVDCMTSINMGFLFMGNPYMVPNTPLSVMTMLAEYNIDLTGKEVVVIGRSNVVGKPLSMLLLGENATVTICHSKTKNLPSVSKKADIVVAAIGRAEMIDETFIKEGAIVIDVGINYENGKIKGDVNQEKVMNIASYLTPVPGGIGSLTTTLLLQNTIKAFENNH
jgi:methylenetetrahydrofolate dehydrogenase (NADP+)/methenyltetrahydrofolate cyclohydrolase